MMKMFVRQPVEIRFRRSVLRSNMVYKACLCVDVSRREVDWIPNEPEGSGAIQSVHV